MLTYEQLKKQPRRFLALTGLTHREFKTLVPAFVRAYQKQYPAERTQAGKPRQRNPGGGRATALASPEARLLFVLVYQKTYALQIVQGELFGLGQAQANYWIHHLLARLTSDVKRLGLHTGARGFAICQARTQTPRSARFDY